MDKRCCWENDKIRMVLLGMLVSLLSPLLVVIYILYGILKCCSVLIPFICLLIVLVIGLPLLTLSKILYGFYVTAYKVVIYFYYETIVFYLGRQRDEQNYTPRMQCVSRTHLGDHAFPPFLAPSICPALDE